MNEATRKPDFLRLYKAHALLETNLGKNEINHYSSRGAEKIMFQRDMRSMELFLEEQG